MASTAFAPRNHSSYMGEIPNYSNNNPRHLNPNPNPNQKPKSNKKKQFTAAATNGRLQNGPVDVVLTQTASDEAYSFNQRPIDTRGYQNGSNYGSYVTYNVASCSRSEIHELRKQFVADLVRVRSLSNRIQSGDVVTNPRLINGKFKKLTGNKRLPSANCNGKQAKSLLIEADGSLMKMCKQVLNKLMKHKLSWVFNKPVDAVALGLHDYHQIVKRPMDLGTVKSGLSKGMYVNPVDFASDVRLVFENAMLYNPRTDEVHGMAEQLLMFFEELFRPIQAKMGSRNQVNRANEFSAVEELDGSSWEDIQSPDRSKKAKTSGMSGPVASNKQNHSTASKPVIPPVVNVNSPVRVERIERMERMERERERERTPSPMQAAEPEPEPGPELEPMRQSSVVSTRGVMPKLPKPRAKDPNKREMNMEEKQKLGLGLQSMPPEKMPQLLQIIRKRNDQLAQEGDEIELDIEALDTETLWELDRFVTNWKKLVSKTKRQALLVNNVSAAAGDASVLVDLDDVPASEKMDVMKKAGDEDVDIGDEMPESSFPHVEIEKDDGGGQVVAAGNGNDNASSSSSGSSSSSSGDSSSSSDSGSGSSSGSDSDADDAQS